MVYQEGQEGLMDPTGTTIYGVIRTEENVCLVPHFLGVADISLLSSVGTCLGKGQNMTWVAIPGQLHPEMDGWMEGFLNPPSLTNSPTQTPTPTP